MSSSKSRNISRRSSSSVAVEVVIQIWRATAVRRTPIPFIIHTQDKLRPDENNDDHDEDECESLDRTEPVDFIFPMCNTYILYVKLPRMRKETLKFTFSQKLAIQQLLTFQECQC